MYSIVLMMALSGSADAPAFGGCRSCRGCNSCCSCSSCKSCSSCHGCRSRRCHGCHGCSSCHSCHSCCGGYVVSCHGCCGAYAAPAAPAAPLPPPPPPPPVEKKPGNGAAAAAPATIVVSLPADAKLTIDGSTTQSASATRTFVSPTLEAGKEYYYTLKAEIVRDGQTHSASKRISVRAGAESRINFDLPVASVAQN